MAISILKARPEMRALAPLRGARPDAPAWFGGALAHQPERKTITVENAAIEILTWGEVGKPGLMFLHGNAAHADWWRFIAPFFARDFRIVAPTWAGMGNSCWRPSYRAETFLAEALAAARAAELYADGVAPIVVAHSLGGLPGRLMASRTPEALRALVLLDPLLQPPRTSRPKPPEPMETTRIYPSLDQALARFLLRPPQPFENLYTADFIARESLRKVEGGWTWKFDPSFWKTFDPEANDHPDAQVEAARMPIAVIHGELSSLCTPDTLAYIRSVLPPDAPIIGIPGAYHHLMIDQPLALVAALRGLFARWPDHGCSI
ncbi:MAG: alpha/beta hydrolase [Pseudomonadota bacterium]